MKCEIILLSTTAHSNVDNMFVHCNQWLFDYPHKSIIRIPFDPN